MWFFLSRNANISPMSTLDYPRLVQLAMRQVVRSALAQIAEYGLDGDHQIYITFETRSPGVEMPSLLRDLYPGSMTIVLEHQFWNLEVDPESFGVTLAFSGTRHRLKVPYHAIEKFVDPLAEFGLQFETALTPAASPAEGGGPTAVPPPLELVPPLPRKPADVVRMDEFRKK